MEESTGPKIPKSFFEKESAKRVIVVLDNASLETVKAGKEFQLLNCDDHLNFFKKLNRDPAEERPDITHQCLMTLLDSPLNKAGALQIFIRTKKNVLIEVTRAVSFRNSKYQVNPQVRIPRTYKRFAGLMVQLLHKFSIRATNGPEKLLKVIKNPVTDHLPTNCRKIVLTEHAKQCVDIMDVVPTFPQVCFVIGAFAHGNIDASWADQELSISNFSLSASVVCSKVCNAFERHWKIL